MPRASSATLAAVAGFALAIGILAYVSDRSAPPPALAMLSGLLVAGPVFGILGQWLPSFVHPLAFSLLTAAARPVGSPPAYFACVTWWAINVAFEIGQHASVSAPLVGMLHGVLGDSWPVQQLSGFFLNGTFDVGDLIAATLGALAAAALMRGTHRWEVRHASR